MILIKNSLIKWKKFPNSKLLQVKEYLWEMVIIKLIIDKSNIYTKFDLYGEDPELIFAI
jgi:hypothetical protein